MENGKITYQELEQENAILRKKLSEFEAKELIEHHKIELPREKVEENIEIYKKHKEEIELSNERLESLLRISQLSTNNIQELLDFALNEAIELTYSKIGYIYFYNETTRQFTLNTWSKEVMNECQVTNPQTVYDLEKTGIWGEAVRQRKPIMINDFQAENPLKKGIPEGHVKLLKFLTIPVIIDNRIVAVTGVGNKITDYDNNDIRQLTLLLDNVWKISERLRLIKELKTAKEKAEENEILLNLILEHSPILMFIKDENIRAIRLSKNFEQLVGLPAEQMLGKSNFDLFPSDFGKKLDDDDLMILQKNKAIEIDEEFNGKFYATIKFPVQIEGRPRYLAGFTIDITERKHTEQALRDSEERWKFALEGANDGLWDWNLLNNSVFFSTQWKAMLGYSENDFPNRLEEWEKRVHPDDIKKSYDDIQLHLDGKTPYYSNIHRLLCKDGTYKWILDRGKIVKYTEEGKPERMIGTHTDLTERMEIEEALKVSEAKSRAILQALPDMMFVHDGEGTILDYYFPVNTPIFNPSIVTIGKKIDNILPKELVRKIKPMILNTIDNKSMQFYEFTFSLPDGEHFFESRSICFGSDKVLSIVRDITERHMAEETIKQKNIELVKLNSDKDRFISVLAHDLKNPFSTILGFLELLGHNLHRYNINQIETQIKIIDGMAQKTYDLLVDLLQWAKSQSNQLSIEPEKIVLAKICTDVVDSLSEQANGKNVSFENLVKDDVVMWVDPILITGVIRNLVSNAIKFSNEKGNIKISSEIEESRIRVTVADNGVGIPEKNLVRLWDKSQPFTTVGTAKEIGTGLGLLLCKEFVELHGGEIWVESEVGVGSKFIFTIPVKSVRQ